MTDSEANRDRGRGAEGFVSGGLRRLLFGDTLLPQEFMIGLRASQDEVAVWLHGMGEAREVTNRCATACTAPLVLCLAFDRRPTEREERQLSLRFCERGGKRKLLGEIGLRPAEGVAAAAPELRFFTVRSAAIHCLPRMQLGMHALLHVWREWKKRTPAEMRMSSLERRAANVTFIRPHPTSLGSVGDAESGNIFIMNLMGELGEGRFAFGLREARWPAHLVERTGRLALSSVPFGEGRTAFRLAANHKQESIAWERLPFGVRPSKTFGIPIPEFALRVREMEVEVVRRIGSHRFFVARIVGEERLAEGEELHAVHGFYQAWRMRGKREALMKSLAQDAFHKQGLLQR